MHCLRKDRDKALDSFSIFFLFFVNETKIQFLCKTWKGICILPKRHSNVKMFSNLKNKSIAVKLPDKTSLLHGNIHPQMECQVEQMFQTFFNFKPKYYQGAEIICNEWMFNLLNMQKQLKVPCCITGIFLHPCHLITNRVWEISCYFNYFLSPYFKIYTCINGITMYKLYLKSYLNIIINKIFYEP